MPLMVARKLNCGRSESGQQETFALLTALWRPIQ
jgi:hypothetical protein